MQKIVAKNGLLALLIAVEAAAAAAQQLACNATLLNGTGLHAQADIAHIKHVTAWSGCCDLCTKNQSCVAWTWNRGSNTCNIKAASGGATSCGTCISGIVRPGQPTPAPGPKQPTPAPGPTSPT